MKKYFLLLLVLIIANTRGYAQPAVDEAAKTFFEMQKAYNAAQAGITATSPSIDLAKMTTAKAGADKAFDGLVAEYNKAHPPAGNAAPKAPLTQEDVDKAKSNYLAAQQKANDAVTVKTGLWPFRPSPLDKQAAQNVADATLAEMIITYNQFKSAPQAAQQPVSARPVVFKDSPVKACICIAEYKPEWRGKGGWLLVFTPLLIFCIVGFIALWLVKGFSVKDALSENTSTKITMENPLYTAINLGLPPGANTANPAAISSLIPPTIDVTPFTSASNPVDATAPQIHTPKPDYRPSISRFIALLSTLVIIAVVVSMSCLFIYRYIAYGCPPDFSNLTGILLALGAGIVPYTVNKVATAASDKG